LSLGWRFDDEGLVVVAKFLGCFGTGLEREGALALGLASVDGPLRGAVGDGPAREVLLADGLSRGFLHQSGDFKVNVWPRRCRFSHLTLLYLSLCLT